MGNLDLSLLPLLMLLPIISFLYASVGHGGASGYLALMALFSIEPELMRPTALVLNIFVASISFWYYYKQHFFRINLFFPFAISSIPAAYFGGTVHLDVKLYKLLLALFLIVAIFRLVFAYQKTERSENKQNVFFSVLIGLVIGFLSGVIGIGGGIVLSPLLLLLGYATIKQAAAISALFIVVNSLSGFAGYTMAGGEFPKLALLFLPFVIIGGSLGAKYGSERFSYTKLTYILAAVLLLASIKLVLT